MYHCAARCDSGASALVKAGDVVKVRVVEVDLKRKRIALSMHKDEAPPQRATDASNEVAASNANKKPVRQQTPRQPKSMPEGALGTALSEALRRKLCCLPLRAYRKDADGARSDSKILRCLTATIFT